MSVAATSRVARNSGQILIGDVAPLVAHRLLVLHGNRHRRCHTAIVRIGRSSSVGPAPVGDTWCAIRVACSADFGAYCAGACICLAHAVGLHAAICASPLGRPRALSAGSDRRSDSLRHERPSGWRMGRALGRLAVQHAISYSRSHAHSCIGDAAMHYGNSVAAAGNRGPARDSHDSANHGLLLRYQQAHASRTETVFGIAFWIGFSINTIVVGLWLRSKQAQSLLEIVGAVFLAAVPGISREPRPFTLRQVAAPTADYIATSLMCVAIHHSLPKASFTAPLRSP